MMKAKLTGIGLKSLEVDLAVFSNDRSTESTSYYAPGGFETQDGTYDVVVSGAPEEANVTKGKLHMHSAPFITGITLVKGL